MPFDKFGKPISHLGMMGDKHASHPAIILKRTFSDGLVKIYADSKGLAEKTEIVVPEGKVVIVKDYLISETLVHYQKIELYSKEGTFRFAIDIFPQDRNMPNPVYRFYYQKSELGRGYGDIAMVIAQKLLDRAIVISTGANTMVDDEVITTIKDLLTSREV